MRSGRGCTAERCARSPCGPTRIFFSERRRFLPGRPTEDKDLPVMVHMNYHADKHKRMLCVWARYGPKGETGACDKFPEGS